MFLKYFFLFPLLLLFYLKDTTGKVFRLTGSTSHATITSTINLAGSGDTIIFGKGNYKINNLAIKKNLFLKGEGFPVFDGNLKNQILSIETDNVIVEGFKFINSGISNIQEISAVSIQNSRNITIRNNIFLNVFFGIYCLNSTNCRFANNVIASSANDEVQSGNGIHCWKSDSLIISGNNITGQRDGIYFEFVTASLINNNMSERNIRYGLHFMFSHNNSYTGNTFRNNGAGVAVMYSRNVKMFRNQFNLNQGESSYGILLKDISDSEVRENTFSSNSIGVYMEGTSRIELTNNTFTQNGWAFRIQASCSDINVFKNKFISNTFDVATNGSLVLNKFENNYWDKYEGYDLNKDGIGDVPYHPVSLYSIITEKMPFSIILFRSFIVMLLERTEQAVPGLTPVDLKDEKPFMKEIYL
jgi:nitrous oxidase accessory protein